MNGISFIIGCMAFMSFSEAQETSFFIDRKLYCYVCLDAPSNEECNKQGLKLCLPNENTCQTEIRTLRDKGFSQPSFRITKRCKQQLACESNRFQNTNGGPMKQCNNNPRSRVSVCRYCCDDASVKGCNKNLGDVQAQCPELDNPVNGDLRCEVDPKTSTQTCRVVCKAGFLPSDITASIITCQSDGKWSGLGSVTTCESVGRSQESASCPQLESVSNGKIICSTKCNFLACIAQTSCSVECDDGYKIVGTKSTICLPDKGGETARWSPPIVEPMKCEAIQCEKPTDPANGNISCSGEEKGPYPYGTKCSVTCSNGFNLLGKQSMACERSGQWSSDSFQCDAVECRPLDLDNGRYTCIGPFGNNSFLSTCNGTCHVGFDLSSGTAPKRVCQSDGSWSGLQATCKIIQCKEPRAPANGAISCSGEGDETYLYATNCSITCNNGFNLLGEPSVTCERSGQWSGDGSRCEAVECPNLSLDNGSYACNGRFGNNSYLSTCNASCDTGFKMLPRRTLKRMCQSNGIWSGSRVRCAIIQCKEPRAPADGEISCSGERNEIPFSYATNCSITCNSGFDLIGERSMTCERSGQWSSDGSRCEAVECRKLNLDNGRYTCKGPFGKNSYLSTCNAACDAGFVLLPPTARNRMCRSNKSWSGLRAKCAAIQCPEPSAPVNGKITCSGQGSESYSHATNCSITCDNGFRLLGERSTTCEKSGQWSSDGSRCEAVKCRKLNLGNGRYTCYGPSGKNSYLSACNAACDTGFDLSPQNASKRVCQSNGTWSGPQATCTVITCPALPTPKDSSMACTRPNGISMYQSLCDIYCNDGFTIVGASSTMCIATNQWSNPLPTCKRIPCLELEDLVNGRFACSGKNGNNVYADVCVAVCSEGYNIVGSAIRYCGKDGTWSGSMPDCIAKCKPLPSPANGRILCVEPNGKNTAGALCTLMCDRGYYNDGLDEKVCLDNKTWSDSTVPLTCKSLLCDRPPNLMNGDYICDAEAGVNNLISSCTLKCRAGYSVIGNPTRNCKDGKWPKSAAWCKANTCKTLTDPMNGKLVCPVEKTNQAFGTICRTVCKMGYTLLRGSERRKCLGNGTWDGKPALCAKSCLPLGVPPHGAVLCVNVTGGIDNEQYTSVCRISCLAGYALSGPKARVCYTSGNWSTKSDSNCTATCTRNPSVANAVMNCTGSKGYPPYPGGTSCGVKCSEGYRATGMISNTTCQPNGTWSYMDTKCKQISCDPLARPNGGNLVCSLKRLADGRYPPGTECNVICNSARAPSTQQKKVCSGTGEWTGNSISCPFDCLWSWSPWGNCDYTGRKNRRIIVLISAKNGGEECPATLVQHKRCCDMNFRRFGNTCYTFHCDNQTWARAEENCRKTGGSLVKVETTVEQQFLKRVLEQDDLPGMWIGLSRRNGQYTWTDGSALGIFSKWFELPGIHKQPDNYKNIENCVKMTSGWSTSGPSKNFDWNDVDCNSNANYICEDRSGTCGNIY